MKNSSLQGILFVVFTSLSSGLHAQQYFRYADDASLQDSFGYAPAGGNPWAIPSAPSPRSYNYEQHPARAYNPPPQQAETGVSAQSSQDRYISEEELQRLERVTGESDLWVDPDTAASHSRDWNEYEAPATPRAQEDAWGKLDTQGLMDDSARRKSPVSQYAPYRFGAPGTYPAAPGFGQVYQPNPYYNLTTPRLDTRTMDNINSGATYMNNSIAPFLY